MNVIIIIINILYPNYFRESSYLDIGPLSRGDKNKLNQTPT